MLTVKGILQPKKNMFFNLIMAISRQAAKSFCNCQTPEFCCGRVLFCKEKQEREMRKNKWAFRLQLHLLISVLSANRAQNKQKQTTANGTHIKLPQ